MPIKPSDAKPNPADPLANPPAVPEVTNPDLPIPLANEQPPDETSADPDPGSLIRPAGPPAGAALGNRAEKPMTKDELADRLNHLDPGATLAVRETDLG